MATSGGPGEGTRPGQLAEQIAGQVIEALPPDVQELLKPGPQSDRINRAIGWAARRDPQVIKLHQRHGAKDVQTLEDVRALPLKKMDDVAGHIARRYRRRAALTGAATGLPGGLWALVAAGADVQLTAIYAVRMSAGIAQSYGYDTSMPEELTHIAEVLALIAGVDSLRGIGNWLTREGLIHYLPEILPRLLIMLGKEITQEQAEKLVGRLVPGVGAVIGGTIDYSFLRVAGMKAMDYYHRRYLVEHGMAPAETVAPGAAIAALPPGAVSQVADGAATVPASRTPMVIPHATPKPRERPPERFGVYLAVFAVFALLITIAAVVALIFLIEAGLGNLIHH